MCNPHIISFNERMRISICLLWMRKNKMASLMMLFVFVVISYGYVLDRKSCKVIEDAQYVPKELACLFQGAGLYQIQTETFERLTLDRLPDDSFLQVMMPTSLQTIEIAEGSCSHVSAAPSLKVVVDGEICVSFFLFLLHFYVFSCFTHDL